ncbi:MAG: hypothetical protein LBS59_07930, partial [Puniceicoccales bacterium]|nr:hypothetical protein [Puniceicoccales bacterium]
MNRIYQGRVSKVETQDVNQQWQLLQNWEGELWLHHALFQDAVNYYITAIAALGSSPDSPLTRLQALLREVWDSADKKGQKREGMGKSFQRVWQLDNPPSLDEVVGRFRQSLLENGVTAEIMQAAGENMLNDIQGEGAIRDNGPVYWPLFCNPDTNANSPDDVAMLSRGEEQSRIRQVLHNPETNSDSVELAPFTVLSIASPNNKTPLFEGAKAREILDAAIKTVSGEKPLERDADGKLAKIIADFSIARTDAAENFARLANILSEKQDANLQVTGFVGSSAKGQIALLLRAFLLFSYLEKSEFTLALLRHFCPPAKKTKAQADEPEAGASGKMVPGAIRKARGNHGYIFRAFTSLGIWAGAQGAKPTWGDFDVAAFKEALKVWSQFKQNVEKREAKLDDLARRLLVMNGENAMA